MDLSNIGRSTKNKKSRRVGRGAGCGRGKTSGRGHKGAGQRKGRTHYIGFEGGNIPYMRKIPKRGFTPKRRLDFQIVNLKEILERLKSAKEISPKELKKVNLIRYEKRPVKVLARCEGEFSLAVTFKAHKFSKKAVSLIEKAGGKIECLPR